MADYKAPDTEIISVANAIRTKGGTQNQLEWPTGFVNAIAAIPSGGGGGISWESYTPDIRYRSFIGSNGRLILDSSQYSSYGTINVSLANLSGKMIRIKNTGDRNYWQIYEYILNERQPNYGNNRLSTQGELIVCVSDFAFSFQNYLVYDFTSSSQSAPTVEIADISDLF